ALADRPDRPELLERPGRAASPTGRPAAILEALEVEPIEARQPAVDGRPGEPEVAGRRADVRAVGPMPVDHRQAGPGGPAQVGRWGPPDTLHPERDEDRRGMAPAPPGAAGRLRHREPPLLLMSEHHQRSEGSRSVLSLGSRLTPRPGPVSRTYLDALSGRQVSVRPANRSRRASASGRFDRPNPIR